MFHSGIHAVALPITRRLRRRTRHLAIAPVSVLIWAAHDWAMRLLAAIVGIAAVPVTAVGVLSLAVVPIGVIATAAVTAVIARLRALAWVGLVITRGAWLRVVVVGWTG